MANHRELARELYASSLGRASAARIWRTVVFSGAMLAAPLAGCGGGAKPAATTPASAGTTVTDPDPAARDKAAADQAEADKQAADQRAAEQAAAAAEAEKAAADQKAKEEAEAKAKEEADAKAAADAEAAAKKKRPRGGNSRPQGRGFVLA
jgi:hypothetical protein